MIHTANPQLAQHIVDYLNELLEISPKAISGLVEYRVPCTSGLVDHPTVQVAKKGGQLDIHEVGLLGILNGLCGCRSTGGGFIAAVVNTDTQQTERFQFIPESAI